MCLSAVLCKLHGGGLCPTSLRLLICSIVATTGAATALDTSICVRDNSWTTSPVSSSNAKLDTFHASSRSTAAPCCSTSAEPDTFHASPTRSPAPTTGSTAARNCSANAEAVISVVLAPALAGPGGCVSSTTEASLDHPEDDGPVFSQLASSKGGGGRGLEASSSPASMAPAAMKHRGPSGAGASCSSGMCAARARGVARALP